MSVERSALNVERSNAAGRAVFLSYGSEDAGAARRICDALRNAGIEVWFDQSELTGGDAWDAKIRGQIGACALFVPVISANTQTRREGYFRLEWKLADERTHLMAEDTPFVIPVAIDQTKESAALVPKSFRAVQWTRLPGGETTAAFVARVKKLLGMEVAPVFDRPAEIPNTVDAGQRPALRRRMIPLLGWGALAVLALGLGLWALLPRSAPTVVNAKPALSPAAQPPMDLATTAGLAKVDAKSIAVLAFANLSSDKDNEYFSDGLSENILDKLARNPGLRVMARTSSFSYKGRNVPISQIGRELNVGTIIEGSVQRAGNRLRITAQLINAADGIHVWSETFDREMTDIFAVQDEIALKIAARLQPGAAVVANKKRPTDNLEAYDVYLRGRALQNRTASNSLDAAKLYERAVALDPNFALAWARLAQARFRPFGGGQDQSPALVADTRMAIDRALQAQPDLPEALLMRARLHTRVATDFSAARRDLERAEALQAAMAELRAEQAILARETGDWPEYFRLTREALSLDPQNGDYTNSSGQTFAERGAYLEADRLFAFAMALQGPGEVLPFYNWIRVRMLWRGPAAALRLLERAPARQIGVPAIRAELLLLLGRLAEARAVVKSAEIEVSDAAVAWTGASGGGRREIAQLSLPADLGLNDLARRRAEEVRADAVREFARGNRAAAVRSRLVLAEIILGHSARALEELADWRGLQRSQSDYVRNRESNGMAALYARLGKADEAVTLLNEMVAGGIQPYFSLRYDPAFEPIRSDPRFQELMAQQEAWAKAQPDPMDDQETGDRGQETAANKAGRK